MTITRQYAISKTGFFFNSQEKAQYRNCLIFLTTGTPIVNQNLVFAEFESRYYRVVSRVAEEIFKYMTESPESLT